MDELKPTENEVITAGIKVDFMANDLVILEEELEVLEAIIKKRRIELLQAMDTAGLASIKANTGAKITVIESQKYVINKDLAMQIIDEQTPEVQEKLLSVNESEFRKLFPTSQAVSKGKFSRYIKVIA